MKKFGPFLLLAALLGGGYWVYTNVLGGSLSGTGPTKGLPTKGPDLPDPGDAVNTGAKGTENGAKGAVDFLANLDPAVWRLVGLLLGVGAIVWILKDPKRRALAFGLGIVALLVVIIA